MTDSKQKTIDFTPMYASHDAFRRDLERLAVAVAEGRAATPAVRAGWENFKHQLHIHQTGDAEHRRGTAGVPSRLARRVRASSAVGERESA